MREWLKCQSADQLRCLVTEFGRLYEGRKLSLNVEVAATQVEVGMKGKIMEVASSFVYLGSGFCKDGGPQKV